MLFSQKVFECIATSMADCLLGGGKGDQWLLAYYLLFLLLRDYEWLIFLSFISTAKAYHRVGQAILNSVLRPSLLHQPQDKARNTVCALILQQVP